MSQNKIDSEQFVLVNQAFTKNSSFRGANFLLFYKVYHTTVVAKGKLFRGFLGQLNLAKWDIKTLFKSWYSAIHAR